MKDARLILGLFFSDENNIVFEKIRFSKNLSEERKDEIKTLSFKFLGPLFLTAASDEGGKWKIDYIESSLTIQSDTSFDESEIIQSFFNLNSSTESKDGRTNLFALIGSPYTEDTKMIYEKMVQYIHPSIAQGKVIFESFLGENFKFHDFINEELTRGLDLIEYSIGSSRKMYWEEQQKYYCVGLIERVTSAESKTTNLYTFDKEGSFRRYFMSYIPSYYLMSTLPNYYEDLINETLKLFGKSSVFPNIKIIELSLGDAKVKYLEEHAIENGITKSHGVILIPNVDDDQNSRNISYYRKNLRLILDLHKNLVEVLLEFNPNFKLKSWSAITSEDLENVKMHLDKRD